MTVSKDALLELTAKYLDDKCSVLTTDCWKECPLKGHPRLCECLSIRSRKYLDKVDLEDRKWEFAECIGNYLLRPEHLIHAIEQKSREFPAGVQIQCDFVTAVANLFTYTLSPDLDKIDARRNVNKEVIGWFTRRVDELSKRIENEADEAAFLISARRLEDVLTTVCDNVLEAETANDKHD